MDRAAGLAALRSDEMLVATVVAVNEMDLTVKMNKIRQHDRRNKIAAVYLQLSVLLIGLRDRASEMGDVIVGVGIDGDAHNDHGQYARMAGYSVCLGGEVYNRDTAKENLAVLYPDCPMGATHFRLQRVCQRPAAGGAIGQKYKHPSIIVE